MNESYEHMVRRTRQYWYEDGLPEMAIGLLFLSIGLIFYAAEVLDSPVLTALLVSLGLPLLFLGPGRKLGRLVQNAKARVTYPRTGYVAYRSKPANRRILVGLFIPLAVAGVLLLAIFGEAVEIERWFPLIDGVLAAFVLIWVSQGLLRFYLISGVLVISGLLLSLNEVGGILGHSLIYTEMGLALLVSGLVTLWLYLRRTESYQEESHGE